MIGSLRPLLEDKQVRIVPFIGYTSLTFLKEAADRIWHERFYFGDFDPSGDHMPLDLEERLGTGNEYKNKRGLDVWKYIEKFKHVAVTFEQRERFNLPEKFDAKTEEKPNRDPRGPAFLEKYGQY